MGAYWLHDIGHALAGLPVAYYSGWETRSRSSGGFDKILGVCIHHTASKTSPESDMNYMWNGSPDRPVGNLYLARDGNIWIGAAGAANTQGKGGPLNCRNGTVPLDKGNQYMIAIEAGNNGTGEAWPKAQTDSYVKLVRQLCDHYGLSYGQDVYGHYDYTLPSCPGRKVDPSGPSPFGSVNAGQTWDIDVFRSAVVDVSPEPEPEPPKPPGWKDDDVLFVVAKDRGPALVGPGYWHYSRNDNEAFVWQKIYGPPIQLDNSYDYDTLMRTMALEPDDGTLLGPGA